MYHEQRNAATAHKHSKHQSILPPIVSKSSLSFLFREDDSPTSLQAFICP